MIAAPNAPLEFAGVERDLTSELGASSRTDGQAEGPRSASSN